MSSVDLPHVLKRLFLHIAERIHATHSRSKMRESRSGGKDLCVHLRCHNVGPQQQLGWARGTRASAGPCALRSAQSGRLRLRLALHSCTHAHALPLSSVDLIVAPLCITASPSSHIIFSAVFPRPLPLQSHLPTL